MLLLVSSDSILFPSSVMGCRESAAPCSLTLHPGAPSHAPAPLTPCSWAGSRFLVYLNLIIKLKGKWAGPDIATLLVEIEETESYSEFTAQEECRSLPGHLDLGKGKSLFVARRQDGFAQNLSTRNEKGSWVSSGFHSNSFRGI